MIGTVENSDVLKENKLKFMDSIERKMKHQQSKFSLLINIIILIFFPRCSPMLSAKRLIQGLRRKHSQALPLSLSPVRDMIPNEENISTAKTTCKEEKAISFFFHDSC